MGRKKKEVPVVEIPKEPLHRCFYCIHWHRNINPNDPDAVDLSDGKCDHNGYSKVPPTFTCRGWAQKI